MKSNQCGSSSSAHRRIFFAHPAPPRFRTRAAISRSLRARAFARSGSSNAKAIKDNTGWGVITIEGHCDERGSEEYNIALGELRARAVKQYLSDLGVSAGRLDVVSFGEAKPAVMGHDESAWRYNRRSEFGAGR